MRCVLLCNNQVKMRALTEQYLSGSRGCFTASTPVLMRPFLVMKWSTRSISCTQRTRTNPRTMMCRAHFWDVSTSFRKTGKAVQCLDCLLLFRVLYSFFFPGGEEVILKDRQHNQRFIFKVQNLKRWNHEKNAMFVSRRCQQCTLQFLCQEARIRLRKAKYMVGSRENSGNS